MLQASSRVRFFYLPFLWHDVVKAAIFNHSFGIGVGTLVILANTTALTLYSFSIENWRRPREEVNTLMHLYADTLILERPTIMAHNIRLRHLGRRQGLPPIVLRELDKTLEVYRLESGRWVVASTHAGDEQVRAEPFAAVELEIARWWLPE